MPSKISKSPQSRPSPWKVEHGCSEEAITSIAKSLAQELKLGDRVLLEGPMGVGKTFFSRALLLAMGVQQPPEGSPTFAIAHEYRSKLGEVVHIDLYRLKSEDEIDDAGIPAYFWEREMIILCEWLSMWPQFEKTVLKSGRNWIVKLSFVTASDGDGGFSQRDIEVTLRKP